MFLDGRMSAASHAVFRPLDQREFHEVHRLVAFFVEFFYQGLQMGTWAKMHWADGAEQLGRGIPAANEVYQFTILCQVIRGFDGGGPIVGSEINNDEFWVKRIHGLLVEIRADGFHKIIRHATFLEPPKF